MAFLACLTCGALSTASYCTQHTPKRGRHRESSTQRGYTAAWQRISAAAIRFQPWCSACGSGTDLTADHIIAKARGGTDHPSNVQVLCRACNSAKGGR